MKRISWFSAALLSGALFVAPSAQAFDPISAASVFSRLAVAPELSNPSVALLDVSTGEIVFESNNAEIGWDGTYLGKFVKEGIYTWKIEFQTTKSDARQVAVGHVNVLR